MATPSNSVPDQQGKLIKIPKVALLLRNDSNKSDVYDPKVVSLGPYHYGKPELKFVEDFKPKALEWFIKDSDYNENYFVEAILNRIEDARSCYDGEFRNISNNEFARMMLLDACFILNDIEISTSFPSRTVASPKERNTIEHLGKAVYLITRRDLYLLENQVPFWILNLLFSLRYGDGQQFVKIVEKYCYGMFFDKEEKGVNIGSTCAMELPSHLLEIFRRVIVGGRYPDVTGYEPWYVFRSVTELKSKGIDFRPSTNMPIKEGVSFISAVLTLPRWYVSIYTKVFFMNMIAYEFDPSSDKDKTVSAYVDFMKSLINSPNDVKELREKKIILNRIGSDEEVVQVYHSLNTYGADDPYLFRDVKTSITQHCDSKAKTYLAEFKSKYFKSPWTAIAFIAGILAFILQFIQAYYAVAKGDQPSKGSKPGSGS